MTTRTCGNCRHSLPATSALAKAHKPITLLRCRWEQQRPPVGEHQRCRMTPPKHEYDAGAAG